jgi:hypothetical protein
MSKWSGRYWADLGERVASTEIAVLLTVLVTTGVTNVDWSDSKYVVTTLVVPPIVTLLKGLLANLANPESGASLLPAPPQGPGPDVQDPPRGNTTAGAPVKFHAQTTAPPPGNDATYGGGGTRGT